MYFFNFSTWTGKPGIYVSDLSPLCEIRTLIQLYNSLKTCTSIPRTVVQA